MSLGDEDTARVAAGDTVSLPEGLDLLHTAQLPKESPGARPEPPAPGRVIKHYELIRRLGAGGMGTVFLARDLRLGRLVAIKLLLEHTGNAAQRFLAEARATARCRHDNIVVIHDVDETDGHPYLVLEYIRGRTLREAMSERAPDTAAVAIEIMLPVARALACAHELGIVHRDLKPENILLADGGQVKVVDFGIAKQVSDAPDPSLALAQTVAFEEELTEDGVALGTLPYMSPEQRMGEPLDARSDIWAAGILLFELATGTHPLSPVSIPTLASIPLLDVPMPSARGKVPRGLADVIDACLQKRKDERMASAQELADALERLGAEKRTRAALADDESPFAGLSAFQEADASRFFGREDDIAAVAGRVRQQQLVAVAGAPGAGKSSFVRAGVIPALKRAGRDLESFVLRPGRRPLAALAGAIVYFAEVGAATGEASPEAIADTLRAQPGRLGERLRARCRKRGESHRILLFVDQLEELYTLGTDAGERSAFYACLEGVADDASSPLRVVVAIRADYVDRVAEDRRFLAAMTPALSFLPPMTPEGLRAALEKPLAAARHRFEDGALCDEMLEGLAGTKSPLPLLQFTASKLWEARDRERKLLTREAYRALGGVAGALSTHADAVLTGMPPAEQKLARSILVRLVTPERTRAVVRMDELCALAGDSGAAGHVISHLAEARLLLIETASDHESKTVELTHESLIERWATLGRWLDENEEDAQFLAELGSAASQWEKNGKAEGFLWHDRAAHRAEMWLDQRRAERGADGTSGLGKREIGYLEAVVGLAQRTRARRRQLVLMLFAAISAIAVVVSGLAIGARAQARRADEQAKQAQDEAREARNATRVAAARERLGDPTTVLALLREIEPGPLPRGWAELALWASGAGVAEAVLLHESLVHAVAWSPDGRRLASGSSDDTVRIWNADGQGAPTILRGHRGIVHAVAWSPDGRHLASASADKTVRVWTLGEDRPPTVLRGHEDRVASVAWSPDGRRLVSASDDGTVRVWDADGERPPRVLRGHEERVRAAAWSPDGRRIASASYDKTVRVWDADGAGPPRILRGHESTVTSAAWSPDGRRIVSASWDKTLRVWNADGEGPPRVLQGHGDRVWSAAWSPDGRRIVSGAYDNTVRVWNADTEEPPVVLQGHGDNVSSVAWRPDGQRIASASYDLTVRVWHVGARGPSLVLRGHTANVEDASFSPDGERIVSASADKTVRMWSADGKGTPRVFEGHDDIVWTAAFSPDGRRIVSASSDKTLRVWNTDGSGPPEILRGHDSSVLAAAFSPDGRRIVSASSDKTLRVWNADGSGAPRVLRGHEDRVYGAAWSPDSRHIVSASWDKTVRVWDADGEEPPRILQGHGDGVFSAGWSPDGLRLISASWDKTVRVWNASGVGEPIVLRGHQGGTVIGERSFTPDGRRIVSSSSDGTVRIWSADGTGEPVVLRASREAINSASWSPDGKRIVAASDDRTVIVWSDLEPLREADDPRLWTATGYCMPLEVRRRLLGFSDAQAGADLERCRRRVAEGAR